MLAYEDLDQFTAPARHLYRAVAPLGDWLGALMDEYIELRTFAIPEIQSLDLDGIGVVEVDEIKRRLSSARVPASRASIFSVQRSDLGELICEVFLRQEYGTRFGSRSIRDRELTNQPGRGIDTIGVETTGTSGVLTLLLAEAKVSWDLDSPSPVVDKADQCLREQHLKHVANLDAVAEKVMGAALRATDQQTADDLITAALYLQFHAVHRVRIVACSVVLRPRALYARGEYGSFGSSPDDYSPADVRFIFVCFEDLHAAVSAWGKSLDAARITP